MLLLRDVPAGRRCSELIEVGGRPRLDVLDHVAKVVEQDSSFAGVAGGSEGSMRLS